MGRYHNITNYRNFTLLSNHNGDVMSFKELFGWMEFKISANRQNLNLQLEDGRIPSTVYQRNVYFHSTNFLRNILATLNVIYVRILKTITINGNCCTNVSRSRRDTLNPFIACSNFV